MGVGYYIVPEREPEDFDTMVDGKAIASAESKLDALAESMGIAPLKDFLSADPTDALGLLEDLGETVDVSELPKAEWFAPSDGLGTVSALKKAIQSDKALVPTPEAVLRDLDDYEQVLVRLVKEDINWHLAVDF